jgi:hypothetical protein
MHFRQGNPDPAKFLEMERDIRFNAADLIFAQATRIRRIASREWARKQSPSRQGNRKTQKPHYDQ